MKKRIFTSILLILSILSTILTGCGVGSKSPISRTAVLFDTVISIQLYDKSELPLLDECIDMCSDYNNRFSRTMEGSEIWNLNHAGGAPVELSDDTIELLELGLTYCEKTEGKFDITIGPLTELWNFKSSDQTPPDTSAVKEAKKHVGYNLLKIDGNTARLLDPQASVDLGGIAKGFIADKLAAYLKSKGVRHAIINLGGNVLTIGTKPDGTSYNIGIQKPFEEDGVSITAAKVDNKSIVTSGVYQRYKDYNGRFYHHILNPVTGYPCENNLLSVTIICKSSADADALSTCCFLMGLENGMRYINSIPDAEALFITSDNKLHYSNNFPH